MKWPGREDERVCQGGTLPWVTYMAARQYQERLMDDLAMAPYRTKEERNKFSEQVYEALACGQYMRDMLEEHYKLVRLERARIERETS